MNAALASEGSANSMKARVRVGGRTRRKMVPHLSEPVGIRCGVRRGACVMGLGMMMRAARGCP